MAFNFRLLGTLPSYPTVEAVQSAMSGDGNTFGACFATTPFLRVWKYDGSTITLQTINTPAAVNIAGIQINADGTRIYASVSGGTAIKRWQWNAATSSYDAMTDIALSVGGISTGLALSPDEDVLVIGCGANLRVCKRVSGTWSHVYNDGGYTQTTVIRFAPDSRTVAIGVNISNNYSHIFYWQMGTNTFLVPYRFTAGGERLQYWTPDQKILLTGRRSLSTGVQMAKFSGTGGTQTGAAITVATHGVDYNVAISAGAFIHGGKRLVVGRYNNTEAPRVYVRDSPTSDHWTQDTYSGLTTGSNNLFFETDSAQKLMLQTFTNGANLYNVENKLDANGALGAPKATAAATVKVPIGVLGQLINPLAAKINGEILVPKAALGNFSAPKAKTIGRYEQIDDPAIKHEVEIFSRPGYVRVAGFPAAVTAPSAGILVTSALKAPKAKFVGSVKNKLAVTAAIKAPKAKTAGEVRFHLKFNGTLSAPKAKTTGAIFSGDPAVYVEMKAPSARAAGDLFLRYPFEGELHAPKAKTAGLIGNLYLSAPLHAPKAITVGLIQNPNRIEGELTAPKGKTDGRLMQDGMYEGAFSAPRATVDGDIYLDARPLSGALKAPKATFSGEAELPAGFFGAVKAPKARLSAGSIKVPLGITGALRARAAFVEGTTDRQVRIDANLRGPKARTIGALGFPMRVNAALSAPKAETEGDLKLLYKIEGAGSAPLPVVDAQVKLIARFSGEMTAPKAIANGDLKIYYEVSADLSAPKATADGALKVRYKLDGALSAPAATSDGELKLRYAVDGFHSSAPAARLEGEIDYLWRINAELSAPSARLDGVLQVQFKVDGEITAPKAIANGELKLNYALEGFTTSAPAATASGVIGQGRQLFGELVARLPVVAGFIQGAKGFTGNLSAPRATLEGELDVYNAVRGFYSTAPAATLAGELSLRYTITGLGSAPKAVTDGEIKMVYSAEGIGSAPMPVVDGSIRSGYDVEGFFTSAPLPTMTGVLGFKIDATLEGELTAPRPIVDGLLSNVKITRRRRLTVIHR